MSLFEEYVGSIVKKLKTADSQEQDELKIEMMDHLLLLKRDYLNKGYEQTDAEKCAIYDFGRSEVIRQDLDKNLLWVRLVVRPLFWTGFVLYLLTLLKYLFLGRITRLMYDDFTRNNISFSLERRFAGVNIIPFDTLKQYILHSSHYNLNIVINNTIGNLVLFVPMGIIVPLLFAGTSSWRKFWPIALTITVGIELLQYITYTGVADIDDVMLYLAGSFLGFGIFASLTKIRLAKRLMRQI